MRKQACELCGSTILLKSYTRHELSEQIVAKIEKFNFIQSNHLLEILSLEGFSFEDIKRELSRLYDNEMIEQNEEKCWTLKNENKT